jgi:transposase
MRPHSSAEELERRRRLAIARLVDGYSPQEVADFLEVHVHSVYRWLDSYLRRGETGLARQPMPGRPPKLTARQSAAVLRWLGHTPQEFGFATSRWTAPRLAWVIDQRFGVSLHPRYLNAWLSQRGISPQIPARVARERDPAAIAHWVRYQWPRIKKSPGHGSDAGFHR